MILVMPATNALSERSFSALRRIKTWLWTTTSQVRLNNCMILHVHKAKTDSLPLLQIGNEFIQKNSSRLHIFGQYWSYHNIILQKLVKYSLSYFILCYLVSLSLSLSLVSLKEYYHFTMLIKLYQNLKELNTMWCIGPMHHIVALSSS